MQRLSAFLSGPRLEFSLYSNLPIDSCKERLKTSLGKEPAWYALSAGARRMTGKIRTDGFVLQSEGGGFTRRAHPVFYGHLIKDTNGTKITGYWGLDTFSKIFRISSTGFIFITSLLVLIFQLTTGTFNLASALTPLAFLAVTIGWFLYEDKAGIEDDQYIIEFLKTSLEASPVTPDKR